MNAFRLALLAVGGLVLGAGALGAWQTSRFVARAAEADGTVARLNAGGAHPQIAFRTRNGTMVSVPQGGMIAGFSAGQTVRVLYDPGDPPGTARLRSFGSLWGSSLALAICGTGLIGVALASFFVPIGFYLRGR